MSDEGKGMSLDEVAKKLGCSYRHVRRLIRDYIDTNGSEGLPASNIGRGEKTRWVVQEDALRAYLDRRPLAR